MEKPIKDAREKVIIRTSLLGIAANLFLVGLKALIGILAHSFAVVIDALNNLSDALSSVITIVGTRLASKKADAQHPLGHGRIEYLTTLVVAFIVLYAGVTALIESVKKIISPQVADYSLLTLLILAAAVLVKILLGLYVRKKGQAVHSEALKASGLDALFDAVLSASVLACAALYLISGLNLEAYIGVLISLFIIRSGYNMLKETLGEIIGRRVPRETVEAVKSTMMQDPDVEGVYDVLLHSYGPDRYVGSAHVSVSDAMTARQIDAMERRLAEQVYLEQGILLTGVGIYANDSGEEATALRNRVTRLVTAHEGVLQMHGFHVDSELKRIYFDVVLDFALTDRQSTMEAIHQDVQKAFPDYEIQAVMDLDV